MRDALLRQTLQIELTNGNEGRGGAWFKSADTRKKLEVLLRSQGFTREPFPHPVQLRVIRVLGKGQRLWDYSSGLRGNWKEIEDALVALGWFVDDSAKWITGVFFFQDASKRDEGPAIDLEVMAS